MNDYIIATSSTSDLPRTYLDSHGIPFIPYTYTVGDRLCEDDCREETRAAVYAGMRNGDRLKTSMINEFVYEEFFRSLMETGKDVLFLDMSREMSVSFVNANKAAEAVRPDYPNQTLYIMDTYCISGGLGTLVDNLVQRHEAGAGAQAQDRAPLHRGRSELPQGGRPRLELGGARRLAAGHQARAVCAGPRHARRGEEGARTQGGAARDSERRAERSFPRRRGGNENPHPPLSIIDFPSIVTIVPVLVFSLAVRPLATL